MNDQLLVTADITVKLVKNRFAVVCLLPESLPDKAMLQVLHMNDEKMNVLFGNPQMALKFDEKAMQQPRQGFTATVGPGGVVESVKAPADDEGGTQAEFPIGDEGEAEPDYAGKEVIIAIQPQDENVVEYVFPIINGHAGTPKKYVNGLDCGHVTGAEVKENVGVDKIGGKGVYDIRTLIGNFGGRLQDAPDATYDVGEEDLDDGDPGNAENWMDEGMAFQGDEGRAS